MLLRGEERRLPRLGNLLQAEDARSTDWYQSSYSGVIPWLLILGDFPNVRKRLQGCPDKLIPN